MWAWFHITTSVEQLGSLPKFGKEIEKEKPWMYQVMLFTAIILDYQSNVFRGIIKELYINGEKVRLSGREMIGNAEVHDCDSQEVKDFAQKLYHKWTA